MKRKTDSEEMQQIRLLKIERNAGILALIGLCAAIVVQQLTGRDGMRELIGEYCVGGTVCVYLTLSCLKNGIWDAASKSKFRYNLIIATVLGLVLGIGMFYGSYKMHGDALNAALSGVCVALLVFCILIAVLSVAAFVYKNRAKKEQAQREQEEREEKAHEQALCEEERKKALPQSAGSTDALQLAVSEGENGASAPDAENEKEALQEQDMQDTAVMPQPEETQVQP